MKKVPPTSRAALWKDYRRAVFGIPLVVLVAALVMLLFIWLSGGNMTTRVSNDVGTAIIWMALIVLIYPVMVVIWTRQLRSGLRDLREWDALDPAARAAAIAAAPKSRRKRRNSPEGTKA